MADSTARIRRPRRAQSGSGLGVLAVGIATLVMLPLVAVLIAALVGELDTLRHLATTVLPRYLGTTAQLLVVVSCGTFLIGTSTAWLVTSFVFPGRRWLEVALVLPLAFPAYVLAYAYTDLLDHPGPVQTALRSVTGWGPRDYWFPEIRSTGGAALMLILVLYPYVYLLARAAFMTQSATPFQAARVLGRSPLSAFLTVSLPMARPAIAAGVLLTCMETLADFGTVSHFGVQTFATGIYQSWFSMADRAAAAQLALGLLSMSLLLALLERRTRRGGRFGTGRVAAPGAHIHLRGWRAGLATLACVLPVLLGALLPAIRLLIMAQGSEQDVFSDRYLGFISNSVTLAGIAAALTVLGAIALGYYRRRAATRLSGAVMQISRLGYAVPGGVIAVGLLVPFAAIDNGLDSFMRESFGISTGLLFTGSIWLLVAAYLIRFMAAAVGAYEGGEAIVTDSIDGASRLLGRGQMDALRRTHLPLMTPSLLSAVLIVFVDVMKELPATMIMRPFNFDTLAVQAHRLAADERLDGAAVPSLLIVAVGVLPVILLIRRLGRHV
ncbi:ABC transporter permease [Palleronia caenipelagi]|uniref:Iron ABC transporter permease n=1 Tax=Palleronia caenipelagi TaxID=2489174 RepID=A0A547Q7R2_9RHOB|nr:iron ABC transporter permease [Palleronia caenipelagi]TRD22422.1 iron ABC transporter permease [Palleronia caenipelagi]